MLALLIVDSLGGTDDLLSVPVEKVKVFCCGPLPTPHDWECKQKEIIAGGFMLCAKEKK